MFDDIGSLKAALAERDREIEFLKSQLHEEKLNSKKHFKSISSVDRYQDEIKELTQDESKELTQDEIKRYSRQLILPEISVEGQIAMKNSKVLIVGAGGLGCPVGMYLAAGGVGTIGIVDYDVLEVSNLHRQISHTEKYIGQDKCVSFARALKDLNSSVHVNAHSVLLSRGNIEEIIKLYDIIVDATDNVPTRYLLNDAAVMFKKPLVSGSALKFEGQLIVYNYLDGPCYRCLFPNPPSKDFVTNCSDGGVIGAVTGVIGSLQALEVIKIILGLQPSYYKKMLAFDGLTGDIRIFKLRGKQKNCEVCGNNPSVIDLIDYELFCNARANDKDMKISLLSNSARVSCVEYKSVLDSGVPHVLLDVRTECEMKICSLPNSINIPISKITSASSLNTLKNSLKETNQQKHYVICRRGNNSQKAVKLLQDCLDKYIWSDIIGGLYAWHAEIDDTLPLY